MLQLLRDQLRQARQRLASRSLTPAARLEQIDIADLLNRPAVNLDTPEVQRFLAGKRVMVTGAGGSIGSEICRQIMRFCPSRLILVEQAENNLFEIDRELRQRWVGMTVVPYIADICDAVRIGQIFQAERPQVVFHCAAHKHVPMMELNPGEAVKNNVFGTKTLADAAAANHVTAFVMVSTDKAVNPTSVMGATKRVAEMYVQSLNHRHDGDTARASHEPVDQASKLRAMSLRNAHADHHHHSGTRFVAVRFGNVLGSSGSVVPIFKKQIAAGGPVTVTHPDMKRYFMTIPEASQLVLQAGAMARGGEVFVLDMGQPVRILDLARDMVRLAGLREGKDIEIQFSGIRPGEKLYEELAMDDERTSATGHEKIRVWELAPVGQHQMQRILELLGGVINADREQVVFALQQSVPEYRPSIAPSSPAPAPTLRLPTGSSTAEAA